MVEQIKCFSRWPPSLFCLNVWTNCNFSKATKIISRSKLTEGKKWMKRSNVQRGDEKKYKNQMWWCTSDVYNENRRDSWALLLEENDVLSQWLRAYPGPRWSFGRTSIMWSWGLEIYSFKIRIFAISNQLVHNWS